MAKVKEIAVKTLMKAAVNEVNAETMEKAKLRYKQKYRELKQAEKVVANIQRELDALEVELNDELH